MVNATYLLNLSDVIHSAFTVAAPRLRVIRQDFG
jgi:hypothetical protein